MCSSNLDLKPMTLIFDLDLDILKRTENQVSRSMHSKFKHLEPEQGRQTRPSALLYAAFAGGNEAHTYITCMYM